MESQNSKSNRIGHEDSEQIAAQLAINHTLTTLDLQVR